MFAPYNEEAGFLGFKSSQPIHGYESIPSSPQRVFRPDYLFVPERFKDWELHAIYVGNQIVGHTNANPIPMDPFIVKMDEATEARIMDMSKVLESGGSIKYVMDIVIPDRPNWAIPRLNLPTVQVGMTMRIAVSNPGFPPIPFFGAFMGRVLRDF